MDVNRTTLIIKMEDTDADENLNPKVINNCPIKPNEHKLTSKYNWCGSKESRPGLAGNNINRHENKYVQNTSVSVS